MQLYLSNSTTLGTSQLEVERSLGGYLSSSPLRNNNLGNIFSDLIMSQNGQEIVEYKAIFLKNTFSDTKTNIYLYYNYPTDPSNIKLEIGVVLPNSAGAIERIQSSDSSPLFATFTEANTETNKVLISSSLASLSSIGIWLKRTILTKNQKTDKQLFDAYYIYRPVKEKYENGDTLTTPEQAIYDNWNNQVDAINFFIQYD